MTRLMRAVLRMRHDEGMSITWPADWQADARAALLPLIGGDERVRITVDPPTCIWGTVLEGFVYPDGPKLMIIHDRSGRADVFPAELLSGPVLRIEILRPRRRSQVAYAHPEWSAPQR